MLTKKRILSINVSQGTQEDFVDEIFLYNQRKQPAYVCFANVHMLVEAYDSATFNTVVNSADIVAPDGFPVAKSFTLIHGLKQSRVDGTAVMKNLFTRCQHSAKRIFFYGGTQSMLDTAAGYLETNYTGLQIAGMYAPPFRPLSGEEKQDVIDHINAANADFVFVVLGCPKQEAWMHDMKDQLTSIMLGIGGALPMMLGLQQRAPVWIQKMGFEWFYRLMQEPRRLFKRYAVTNSKFIFLLTAELLRMKLGRVWPSLLPKTL